MFGFYLPADAYLTKGKKVKERLNIQLPVALSLLCAPPEAEEQGVGSREVVAAGCLPDWDVTEGTRRCFERWKILGRLLLCWLQVPVLCTSLQSHAGLIMSSSKCNVFTKCAGFSKLALAHVYKTHRCSCAQPLTAADGSLSAGELSGKVSDPERGGHRSPSWPSGSGGTGRSCHSSPFSGNTGRCVCGWVGGQAVIFRSIICSSL